MINDEKLHSILQIIAETFIKWFYDVTYFHDSRCVKLYLHVINVKYVNIHIHVYILYMYIYICMR